MKKIFASAMLASSLMASNSFGAEIKTEKWDNGYNIITISGEIVSGDGDKFRNISMGITGPVVPVIIASNGGMVADALKIGETIKAMGYSTYVPNNAPCNSACGLIWIAGVKRFIDPETKIGFHGAYNGATLEAASVGNALIGSYFSRLHLSDAAIEYATMASPTNLNYITVKNANVYGIKVFLMQDFKPQEEQRKALCYDNGETAVLSGIASFNRIDKKWYLGLDKSVCISNVNRKQIMIMGSPPPENTKIELTGTIFNNRNDVALKVERGRKIH